MEYLQPYIPILIVLVLAVAMGTVLVTLSALLGPKKRTRAKDMAYECGIVPTGQANVRIPVKFYLVALLFLLFDMETIMIIAWAIAFRDPAVDPVYAFFVMIIFLAILLVGFIYEWRKGALEWR